MNTQKMIMIPVWQYEKMVKSYDKLIEENCTLKERVEMLELRECIAQ